MWCAYIVKKSDCRKIIPVITIFGGLSVLMPYFIWMMQGWRGDVYSMLSCFDVYMKVYEI
jgi:hypothetical protein